MFFSVGSKDNENETEQLLSNIKPICDLDNGKVLPIYKNTPHHPVLATEVVLVRR